MEEMESVVEAENGVETEVAQRLRNCNTHLDCTNQLFIHIISLGIYTAMYTNSHKGGNNLTTHINQLTTLGEMIRYAQMTLLLGMCAWLTVTCGIISCSSGMSQGIQQILKCIKQMKRKRKLPNNYMDV